MEDVTGPGFSIFSLHWVCQPCRWGEHEACEYPNKICYCVECYGEEEQDE